MTRIEEINLEISEINFKERKSNNENIDDCLSMIKDICLKYDLRVGQLFETMRHLSDEKDLFSYSNKKLELTIEKEFLES